MLKFAAILATLTGLANLRDVLTKIENVYLSVHDAVACFTKKQADSLTVAAMKGGLEAQPLSEDGRTARAEFLGKLAEIGYSPDKANALTYVLRAACAPVDTESQCVAKVLAELMDPGEPATDLDEG